MPIGPSIKKHSTWLATIALCVAIGVAIALDIASTLNVTGSDAVGLGIAVGFARVQLALPSSILFVAIVQVCRPIGPTADGLKHWRRSAQHGLVVSDQVVSAMAYVDFGESFVPASHS